MIKRVSCSTVLVLLLTLAPMSTAAAGGAESERETVSDELYGASFPGEIDGPKQMPRPVPAGSRELNGYLVSLGSTPFNRPALKVFESGEYYYYILDENRISEMLETGVLSGNGEIVLRGTVEVRPVYLVNGRLSSLEYHLIDFQHAGDTQ
ncbi:hypothetical protein [Salinispira pacifica]|uniref:hypothetical protein n=1 Tax=Salinispira pacifica TaxID=1307761 RepID=UPI00146FADD9|nr:hypothetical protein [Salinispira pacifica]